MPSSSLSSPSSWPPAGRRRRPGARPARGDAPVVFTTFYPTTYFAGRLAGADARVVCPLPADADPIFWSPDDATIEAYQQADLIVVNGARFEKWVLKTSLPDARVVDTAKPFASEFLRFAEAVEHSHGPSGKHAHEGVDGHTWMDPLLAKQQAAEIARALKALLPERAQEIDARLAALHADLDEIHQGFEALTARYRKQPLLASHPAYNYPAFRYGWTVRNLNLDPESMPNAEQEAGLAKILEDTPARHILWESPPLPDIAERLKEKYGLESVEFSPCEVLVPRGPGRRPGLPDRHAGQPEASRAGVRGALILSRVRTGTG